MSYKKMQEYVDKNYDMLTRLHNLLLSISKDVYTQTFHIAAFNDV